MVEVKATELKIFTVWIALLERGLDTWSLIFSTSKYGQLLRFRQQICIPFDHRQSVPNKQQLITLKRKFNSLQGTFLLPAGQGKWVWMRGLSSIIWIIRDCLYYPYNMLRISLSKKYYKIIVCKYWMKSFLQRIIFYAWCFCLWMYVIGNTWHISCLYQAHHHDSLERVFLQRYTWHKSHP